MAEPQFSVRSAKARDLAHRLARRETCSIAAIATRNPAGFRAAGLDLISPGISGRHPGGADRPLSTIRGYVGRFSALCYPDT